MSSYADKIDWTNVGAGWREDPRHSNVRDTKYAVRWQHAIDPRAGRAFARELLAVEYTSPRPRYTLIRFLKTKR